MKLNASILHEKMQILSLQFVQALELVFEFVDLTNTAATVGVQEWLRLRLLNAELLPKRLDRSLQIAKLLLAVLFFVRQAIALGAKTRNVLLVKT